MTFRSPGLSGNAPRAAATALSVGHLLWVSVARTARWEHALADFALLGVAWSGGRARPFLRAALPLWLTGILFDNQGLWLHLRGPIHTGDLWKLDALFFPAGLGGASNWPEFFSSQTHVGLDALAGLAYATYLVEFLALLVALFLLGDSRFERMAWAFFAVNALGVLVYVLYPAAPPWYVMQHGPGAADVAAAVPSAAGAARFDALIGADFFAHFYARNPNVFGAVPSLHTAYPVVALWHVWRRGLGWRIGAAGFAGLIAFSAVYLSHHYVVDVLAGAAAALAASGTVHLFALWFRAPLVRAVPVPARARANASEGEEP